MADRQYGAGEDIPGTPGPFPFDLLAGLCGFAALLLGLVAMFAEPLATFGYWFTCLDWLVLSLFAILRGERSRGIWLGSIGVLAPLATSVILGSNVLIQIPG
ncbi:MAG: hypothetical protein V4574_12145 [Pseudomonadota bacterium]